MIKHQEFKPYDYDKAKRPMPGWTPPRPELDLYHYHRHSLVETVISVLKRRYGPAVSSWVW